MNTPEPTVYVVDDDENVRNSLSQLAEAVGLNVKTFPSAQKLLDSDDYSYPGCLVLDIRMPGMSGLELQRELKDLSSNIPIIFITGHGDIGIASEAFKNGAIDFIEKPFRDQVLLEAVNRAIKSSMEIQLIK